MHVNPFRYLGYYYDAETGFYYCNSRYYDPEVGRWVNADGVSLLAHDLQNITQYNMFSYCWNNPVNMIDPTGEFPVFLIAVAVVGVTSITAAIMMDVNYAHNSNQSQFKGGYIDSQRDVNYFNMGFFGAGHSGCGWIAVYNAMIMLGDPQPAADVIKYFDYPGRNILFGALGTDPTTIAGYFSFQGYSGKYNTTPFSMPSSIESAAQSASANILFYTHSTGAHFAAFHRFPDFGIYRVYNDPAENFTTINEYMQKANGTFVTIWCID